MPARWTRFSWEARTFPADASHAVTTLKTVIVIVALAYAGVVALMWLTQDSQIFLPQASRGRPVAPPGWSIEKVSITAADGTPLAGVLVLPPRQPGLAASPAALVMHFGGNAEEVTANAFDAERLYGRLAVLLVNYRGYGASGGRPSEKALVADALSVHDWAARRADLDANRFCAHGRSLGTGVAVQLAAARPLMCIVLTSPFESLVAVGQSHMPWLPVGLLLRHRFESLSLAPTLTLPALVISGEADTIIPPVHSERLAAAWGGPVERLRLESSGHNDIDSDLRYARAIAAFLERHIGARRGPMRAP